MNDSKDLKDLGYLIFLLEYDTNVVSSMLIWGSIAIYIKGYPFSILLQPSLYTVANGQWPGPGPA